MWLILIEALVALCLLVLIVWLTMAPSRAREKDAPPSTERDQGTDDKG